MQFRPSYLSVNASSYWKFSSNAINLARTLVAHAASQFPVDSPKVRIDLGMDQLQLQLVVRVLRIHAIDRYQH